MVGTLGEGNAALRNAPRGASGLTPHPAPHGRPVSGRQIRGPPFLDPGHSGLQQFQPIEEAQHLVMIAEGEIPVAKLVEARGGLGDLLRVDV
jgi:hypothetical protein